MCILNESATTRGLPRRRAPGLSGARRRGDAAGRAHRGIASPPTPRATHLIDGEWPVPAPDGLVLGHMASGQPQAL